MNKILKRVLIFITILLILIITCKILNIEEKISKIIYPIKYKEYVYKYSEELNIDPMLMFAIIKTESNFKENAESKSGAIGLMQLMENTAKEQAEKINIEYSKKSLYEPETNIRLGLNYFNALLEHYNKNYVLALAAYNAGIGNVQKWIQEGIIKEDGADIENIPFKETNMYVRKVLSAYEEYIKIYSS